MYDRKYEGFDEREAFLREEKESRYMEQLGIPAYSTDFSDIQVPFRYRMYNGEPIIQSFYDAYSVSDVAAYKIRRNESLRRQINNALSELKSCAHMVRNKKYFLETFQENLEAEVLEVVGTERYDQLISDLHKLRVKLNNAKNVEGKEPLKALASIHQAIADADPVINSIVEYYRHAIVIKERFNETVAERKQREAFEHTMSTIRAAINARTTGTYTPRKLYNYISFGFTKIYTAEKFVDRYIKPVLFINPEYNFDKDLEIITKAYYRTGNIEQMFSHISYRAPKMIIQILRQCAAMYRWAESLVEDLDRGHLLWMKIPETDPIYAECKEMRDQASVIMEVFAKEYSTFDDMLISCDVVETVNALSDDATKLKEKIRFTDTFYLMYKSFLDQVAYDDDYEELRYVVTKETSPVSRKIVTSFIQSLNLPASDVTYRVDNDIIPCDDAEQIDRTYQEYSVTIQVPKNFRELCRNARSKI